MTVRNALLTGLVATVVLSFLGNDARAAVWTTGGGTFSTAQINTNIADGDSIVVDVDTIFNVGDATNTDKIVAITVNAAVTLTVNFTSTGDVVLGNTSAAAITVNGTMTVTGTGGGNMNFSGETNQILTVIGTIGGTASGNTLDVGNNTLRTTTGTSAVNIVSIGGANAQINPQFATTITTLTVGGALNVSPADTIVLTVTNPTNVGANKITFTGSGGGGAEAVNGTFVMNNAISEIETAGADVDDVLGDVTVTVSADGATLDTNFNTSPVAVNMTAAAGNLTLQVATGKTLTTTIDVNDNTLTWAEAGTVSTVQLDTATGIIAANAAGTITTLTHTAASTITLGDTINFTVTNAFNLGANKLTLNGSAGGGQDTFTATVQLNNAASELETGGADADNLTGFTVTATADGGTLDTNFNTAPAAVNMTTTAGDLTLQVATGKTMTTTVDVNANSLTLAETGTISTVNLDTAAATIQANAAATITTLGHTAAGVINLGNTINLTVTNAFNLGANKLTLNGSGAGAQDTFTATVQLNNAASELEVAGADVDNINGFTVTATADGGTLDTNINTAPTAVNMSAGAGNLTLEVATGKTMTTTIDVNDNTLTWSETGTVSTVQMDTATGIIAANAAGTITTLAHTAANTITLGNAVNFTVTNPFNLGANKLTLNGSGAGAQDTFTATVQLDNAASELETGGADVDNLTGFTVTATADGGTLDTNFNTTPTAVNMTTTAGDLTLEVATGKTMTTTVDVNANTLTLSETGTVSTVQLDTTAATIQANGSGTITTLAHTAAGVINLGDTVNLTVTNPFNVGAFKLSLAGSGGGGQDTLTATAQLNNAASELEVTGADADNITGTTVTVSADGATLDTNINTAPTAVNMTAGAGDLTLEVAAKTMTTTIDVNDNTLTITEAGAGTVSTVQMDTAGGVLDLNTAKTITNLNASLTSGTATYQAGATTAGAINVSGTGGTLSFTETGTIADLNITGAGTAKIAAALTITDLDWTGAGTLDVDAATTATNADLGSDGTIDVATGITLTATNGVTVVANNLTLSGPGTITRINATTGTITDNGGATVSDLRATFGSGGTFIWSGTGTGTITTIANALPGAGETFQKTGTGSVTIVNGFTTAFAAAAGVKLDIDAGTVVVGAAGSNDDLTFDDDADEVTVASGGTLTTFGSFTVGAAGANVNLDAATGSTVNLSSTAGAETITAAANDDFNLLGTVNINGSNGDYTISDAFDYKLGSVSINTTGSLINNIASGEMRFIPGSAVTLAGSATLTVNGQATGTRIVMNTTTGSGVFTLNRGSSTNFSIQNASITNAAYADSTNTPATCNLTFTGVLFSGTSGFDGSCSGGGGGGGGGGDTPPTDTGGDTGTDTPTDEVPADEPTDEPTDGTVGDTPDTTDGDVPNEPVVRDAGDDGIADLANDKVDVIVEGLRAGTAVELDTDVTGDVTLTVGDAGDPGLVVMLSGTREGSDIGVSLTDDGGQILVVTNSDGTPALSIGIEGLGDNPIIDATIDGAGDQTILLRDAAGASFSFGLKNVPDDADVDFAAREDGTVEVDVVDSTGEAAGVSILASDVFRAFGITVTYDEPPDGGAATSRVIPGFAGLEDEQGLGGSVTLAATGLTTTSVVSVDLSYTDADLSSAGITEADLRLHRFNTSKGEFEPAGENDRGARAPSGVLGDYGVDTSGNGAWAEVTALGQFVVGVPKVTQGEVEVIPGCAGGGLCGTMGIICLPACFAGLVGMKRRVRRR